MKNHLQKARTRRMLLAVVCILALAIPAALMALAEDPYTVFAVTTFEGIQRTGGAAPTSTGASEKIEGLSVVTNYTTNYPTYESSPDLAVTLNVSINLKYQSGGTIELPLNFTPKRAEYQDFDYGTNGTDGPTDTMPAFFSFVPPTTANVIVDRYDLASKPGTLVIHLKNKGSEGFTTGGMYPIPLTFAFNQAWSAKIPHETTLWVIAAKAYVGEELAVSASTVAVKGFAQRKSAMGVSGSYVNPINQYYSTGTLTFMASHTDGYSVRHVQDPTYPKNIYWIEIPTGSTPTTAITSNYTEPEQIDYNDSGFDRYENSGSNDRFHGGKTLSFTPPTDMTDGTSFEVRFGYKCKLVNDKEVIEKTAVVTYIKTSRAIWEIYLGSYHTNQYCGISDGSIGGGGTVAASNYENGAVIKNTGGGAITGVFLSVYQATATSPKVNFSQATLHVSRDPADKTSYPEWSQYKVQYEILDTAQSPTVQLIDDEIGIWKPTSNTAVASLTLKLPSLTETQYINQFIVTPMGVDGLSEGVWPGQNAMGFQYFASAWNNQKWPDRSDVPEWSIAEMGWRLFYDNNIDKPNAYPAESGTDAVHEGPIAQVYYCDGPNPMCSMASTNASNVSGGDVVDYIIYGYVTGSCAPLAKWNNPRIMVRVPIFQTLLASDGQPMCAVGATTTFIGTYKTGTFDVTATLTGIDDTYYYYTFQAQDFSLPRYDGMLNISVQFKVAENALAGTYIPYLALSSQDAANFVQNYTEYLFMDTLTTEAETLMGLKPDDRYWVQTGRLGIGGTAATSSLIVRALPEINEKVAMEDAATSGQFVAVQESYTEPGDQVTMRLTLLNNGNAPLNNIRFYNILPQKGDNLGTTDPLSYVSIKHSATTTVTRYWAIDGATMPTYGEHGDTNPDLQSFGTSAWSTTGWSTSDKGANTKAVYFNFGTALVLQPGQSVDIDITFQVPPDAINQIAYNQFRFSARQSTATSTIMNLNSSIASFKTYQMNVKYDQNLSIAPATPDSAATDMPAADPQGISATAYMGFGDAFIRAVAEEDEDQDGLTVDDAEPKITGYTFAGWNDKSDGSGTAYSANSAARNAAKNIVTFTGAGTTTLYAQWDVNKYAIGYNYDGTVPAAAPAAPAGEPTVAYATAKTVAAAPALAGYTFSGWDTSDVTVVAATSSFTMPDNPVAFTGTWSPNPNTPYTVQHYYVDGNGTAAATPFATEQLTGTTDTPATATPKTGLTGYTYDSTYPGTVASGNIAGNGSLMLKLYYRVSTYAITYAYTGAVPKAAPAAPAGEAKVPYGASKTVAVAPSLTGYAFSGWKTTDAAVSGNAFTMPDKAVAFTGSWSPNPNTPYTVQHYYVDGNGTAAATPFATEQLTGTTDTLATATPKTGLIGYTYDSTYPGTIASGNIAGNGSLMLKLYYRVSTYAITYAYTGAVPKAAPPAPAGEAKVPYGASKTVAGAPSLTGYAFSGWKTTDAAVSGNAFTMPDKAVAFTGSWLPKTDLNYTVKYLEQGTAKALAPDKTVTGQTFLATVTEQAIDIKGYTVVAPESQFMQLNEYDLVMTFFYTAKPVTPSPAPTAAPTPGAQQVRVSFYNSMDDNRLIYSELVSIGGSVTPPTPPEYDGYVFTGWQGVYQNVQKNENVFTRYIQAETLSIKITKSWIAPAGATLPPVTVRLLRDGMQYRSLKLDGSEGWVGYFTDLPQSAADGHTYVYGVTENSVPGFTLVSISGSANETEGFTLANRAGGANGQYKVTFVDWDGTELKHEYVAYGGSATPPQSPQRTRYSFAGWTGNWQNVTHDEFVFARYGRAAYGVSSIAGVGEDGIAILDAAIPLAGGSVSNFGDCIE